MLKIYHIPCPRDPEFVEPECKHEMAVYVKLQANGQKLYRRRCRHCGFSEEKRILKKNLTPEIEASAIEYDGYLDKWRDFRAKAMDDWRRANGRRWWQWYNEYLDSEVWEIKRRKVLARCKGICESCFDAPAVQAHHTSYALVGREPLYHLRGLCIECHEYITANGNGIRWDR